MSLMKLDCTAKLSSDKLMYLREPRLRLQCSSVKCYTAKQIRGAQCCSLNDDRRFISKIGDENTRREVNVAHRNFSDNEGISKDNG
jgi:hypothetical protein